MPSKRKKRVSRDKPKTKKRAAIRQPGDSNAISHLAEVILTEIKKKDRKPALIPLLPPELVLDPLRVRKGLTNKPKVLRHVDHKGYGLVRVLTREKDFFPEFAVYPDRSSKDVIQSLKDAGLKEEQRGKWVLRTNRFNIFVYV
jgi:hypothetical protein